LAVSGNLGFTGEIGSMKRPFGKSVRVLGDEPAMIPPDPRLRPASLTACALVMAASLGVTAGAAETIDEASAVEQISRYCTTSWRNAGIDAADWGECTQEAFAELLSRVSRDGLPWAIANADSDQRRELNRSIWCTTQRWRRAKRHGSLDAFEIRDSRADDPAELVESDDLRDCIDEARGSLTPRQSRIIGDWIEGYGVGEIAERLDTTPARVSDEKYKAIHRLRRSLSHLA
jgi:RNA polymerase sigma factor (sigma-70 family)